MYHSFSIIFVSQPKLSPLYVELQHCQFCSCYLYLSASSLFLLFCLCMFDWMCTFWFTLHHHVYKVNLCFSPLIIELQYCHIPTPYRLVVVILFAYVWFGGVSFKSLFHHFFIFNKTYRYDSFSINFRVQFTKPCCLKSRE